MLGVVQVYVWNAYGEKTVPTKAVALKPHCAFPPRVLLLRQFVDCIIEDRDDVEYAISAQMFRFLVCRLARKVLGGMLTEREEDKVSRVQGLS